MKEGHVSVCVEGEPHMIDVIMLTSIIHDLCGKQVVMHEEELFNETLSPHLVAVGSAVEQVSKARDELMELQNYE